MSKLACWTRYDSRGYQYTTCEENGKQLRGGEPRRRTIPNPRRTNTDRLNQLAIERDNLLNTERLNEERELDEFLDLDNFGSFLEQANQQVEDMTRERERSNRQEYLRRDRRRTFIEMTEQDDRDNRREAFTRTLSRPTEFMGSSYTAPQEPVNPRYLKRMEKTKKQIAEGNYKSEQARYRALRTEKNLQEYLDLDAKSKQSKSQVEYDAIRKQMDEGEFMKWEKYNTAKNKKAQEKKKKKRNN
jgi:hypothetical protein